MLGKRIPTYYRLEFSEVLLDLYGSQYFSRTEMLYRLVKNWGKE